MNVAINPPPKRANRLQTTKLNNRMVTDYWESLFRAPEEGRLVCWYEGVAINPILQAADIAWCHGEAMSALLAAKNEEGPAQDAAEEAGYDRELCSYARTHIGCSVMTQRSTPEGITALPADSQERKGLAARIPVPDMIISAYPFSARASNGTTSSIAPSARECRSSTSRCRGSGAISR